MKADKFGKHVLIVMKDILSEAQFLRILLYLKRGQRRNNTFLYLTRALGFEYSAIY